MLYVIKAGESGPYKIGYTNQELKTRIATIQTSHHQEIDVVASVYSAGRLLEQSIHSRYRDRRIRGEWFHLSSSDVVRLRKLLGDYRVADRKTRECTDITHTSWEALRTEPVNHDFRINDDWYSTPASPKPIFYEWQKFEYHTKYEGVRLQFSPVWRRSRVMWYLYMEVRCSERGVYLPCGGPFVRDLFSRLRDAARDIAGLTLRSSIQSYILGSRAFAHSSTL